MFSESAMPVQLTFYERAFLKKSGEYAELLRIRRSSSLFNMPDSLFSRFSSR